jgi:hypothetical protein
MYSFTRVHLVIKFLVVVQFFCPVQKYKDAMRTVKFEGFIEATTSCVFFVLYTAMNCVNVDFPLLPNNYGNSMDIYFYDLSDGQIKNVLTMYNRNSMRKKCSEYEQMKYNYSLYETSFRHSGGSRILVSGWRFLNDASPDSVN